MTPSYDISSILHLSKKEIVCRMLLLDHYRATILGVLYRPLVHFLWHRAYNLTYL